MLVAIPVTIGVWLWTIGISNLSTIFSMLGGWVWKAWHLVWEGKWSLMSPNDLFFLLLVGSLGSALVLVPWCVLYLYGPSRWSLPRALWWWSALYGLMPFSVGAIFLSLVLFEVRPGATDARRFGMFVFTEFALGLAIAVLGFRAWQRRRREDRAALPD